MAHTLGRRAVGVAAVTGTAAATLLVSAEPAAADHKDYCGFDTNYAEHASYSYRVVYDHQHVQDGKIFRHYIDQVQTANGWETIGDYHKQCG